jgi:hypothetical protein
MITDRIMGGMPRAILIVLLVVAAGVGACLPDAGAVTCNNGTLPLGGGFQDLDVTGPCVVAGTTGTDPALYQYGNVNIYVTNPAAPNALAYLKFADKKINFWAHSILVENKGQLLAGVAAPGGAAEKPLGTAGGALNIYIWGKSTDTPIKCKSPGGMCGVPPAIWNSNSNPNSTPMITKGLPGGVDDYFYNYNFMSFGTGKDANSFFGSKVIAVSFGGTMKFAGARGASYRIGADTPSNTGTSWVRLNTSLDPQDKEMVVQGLVDWQKYDHVVITSTDYIPGHAEELVVQLTSQNPNKTTTIRFTNAVPGVTGVKYYHNGAAYNLAAKLPPATVTALGRSTVETRAAVGLLSRSIQIQSAGDMMGELFPSETSTVQPNYFFGAHSVVRQGFAAYQVQGVSFYQMGQGGQIAHYPVHFHMVRKAPNDTYVKDCSVWDSMTRWITLHATQNVTLQRNVGYKSIGHGYYIEDGAEANNRLYANLGVLARAAVKNKIDPMTKKSLGLNPRSVPGILVAPNPPSAGHRMFPYYSDVDQPSVFWIMNGWNDFEYNMAAGAGTCGACYWLVPSQNSGRENSFQFGTGPNDYKAPLPNSAMTWRGYSAMQGSFTGTNGLAEPTPAPTPMPIPTPTATPAPGPGTSIQILAQTRAGMAPLYKFVGNSCSTAMNSFVTVGGLAPCSGVGAATTSSTDVQHMIPIANPAAPPIPAPDPNGIYADPFYPRVTGLRKPTRCGPSTDPKVVNSLDCSRNEVTIPCSANSFNPPPKTGQSIYNCEATVLDHYTTSFNWAQTNFAAIWLRPFWHLLLNSAVTDSQNGGITFVTGGDYTRASVIDGMWDVAKKTVFIGHTQPEASSTVQSNPFASAVGPFNPTTGIKCPITDTTLKILPNACIIADEGVDFEVTNFSENQRLFSIYDGPAYQDTDAFVDVEPSVLTGLACTPTPGQACPQATQLYARAGGILKDAKNQCYLPNAAIAWKSPNGFFYPPAFHSVDLSFANSPIRHFVIEPEFVPGTFGTDINQVTKRYCSYPTPLDPTKGLFEGFSDVDRQTVLNDDDGTLTGLKATVTPPIKPDVETISVNFDDFFDAPIQAVECGSDASNPPASSPPGTAKTSPYEHLTTVVYPACARLGGPPAPEVACGMAPGPPPAGQNPNWGSDCGTGTGPTGCYGVPLLRQNLISGETVDPNLQGIRMMGANEWQRNALTNNYGTYYINTASNAAAQTGSPVKNIFEANRTYYVFLVYAKPTTHQTYQMWVGPGLAKNWAETNVFMTRVFPGTINFQTFDQTPANNWPSTWTREYDRDTGILTVTVDMNFTDFTTNFAQAEKDFCLPYSFCTLQSNQCVCNPADRDFKLCNDNNICGAWAGKDIDWPGRANDSFLGPVNGAYGFGLRLPSGFSADGQNHRPMPACVMKADTGWNIPLVQAMIPGDACFNTPVQYPAGSSPLFCP